MSVKSKLIRKKKLYNKAKNKSLSIVSIGKGDLVKSDTKWPSRGQWLEIVRITLKDRFTIMSFTVHYKYYNNESSRVCTYRFDVPVRDWSNPKHYYFNDFEVIKKRNRSEKMEITSFKDLIDV